MILFYNNSLTPPLKRIIPAGCSGSTHPFCWARSKYVIRSRNTPSSLVLTIAMPQSSVPFNSHHSQSVKIPLLSWRTSSERRHSFVAPSNRVRASHRTMYCAKDSLLTGNASAGSSNIKSDDAADTSFSTSSSYHPSIISRS